MKTSVFRLIIQVNYNTMDEINFDTRKEAVEYLNNHYQEYKNTFGEFTSQIKEY